MAEKETRKGNKCPECKGTGYIVLLISRSECRDCSGTGITPLEEEDTQKVRRRDINLEDGYDDSLLGDERLEFDDEYEGIFDPDDWYPAHNTF